MNQSRPWLRVCRRCARNLGGACLTSACWLLWTALSISLVLLATVWFRRELSVPDFLLRRLEQKLEFAHLTARFGRTAFDPHGNILLEDVRLFGAGIEEPLVRAGAIRLHLNLWAVTTGDFDVRRVEVTDARLDCPAIVSPSGVSEPVVADLGATILREGTNWSIPDASFHAGKIFATATVEWRLPPSGGPRRQLPPDLLKDYIALARKAAEALRHTATLEQATLHLAVAGQPNSPPRIHAALSAGHASFAVAPSLAPLTADTLRLAVETVWRPSGLDPATLSFSANRLTGPHGLVVSNSWARTSGRITFQPFRWVGGPIEVTAGSVKREQDAIVQPRGTIRLDALPQLNAEFAALVGGDSPVDLKLAVDTAARSAEVELAATLAPGLLNDLTARAAVWRKSRLLARIQFSEPATLRGHVDLSPGWQLREARAALQIGAGVAAGTTLSATEAELVIDPRRLRVEPLVFHSPDTEVRGSYEMDLKTQDYRFLLKGHFFPSLIDAWFSRWWTDLWDDFKFGRRPPEADLDIQNNWRAPHRSIVYGRADVGPVAVRGVPLDSLRATFFIRPEHYDFLAFDARRGPLATTGGFTRHDDSETKKPQWITFDLRSTLPLPEGAKFFGPEGERMVEPFVFAQPPEVAAAGRMEWTSAGFRQDVRATAAAQGEFRFHEFPVHNPKIAFDLLDDAIHVRSIAAEIAGGPLTGSAEVTGPIDNRRLAFAGKLEGADLAGTVRTWADYRARTAPPGTPPMPESATRLGDKGRFDLTLEGAGPLENLYALQGLGTAGVRGAELADIELLGALSRVLRGTLLGFTSLQFTDADAKFALNGEHLDFSSLKITGPTAEIKGKGRYAMPSSDLSFNVKLFPFRESSFPVFTVLGTVLTPLSHAFEVHLGGTLAKPEWSLAGGAGSALPTAPAPPGAPPPAGASRETQGTAAPVSPH